LVYNLAEVRIHNTRWHPLTQSTSLLTAEGSQVAEARLALGKSVLATPSHLAPCSCKCPQKDSLHPLARNLNGAELSGRSSPDPPFSLLEDWGEVNFFTFLIIYHLILNRKKTGIQDDKFGKRVKCTVFLLRG